MFPAMYGTYYNGFWERTGLHSEPLPHGIKINNGLKNILEPPGPKRTIYMVLCCTGYSVDSLRSASRGDFVVPHTRTSIKQHKAFSIVGPSAWNSLPSELRSLPRDLPSSFYKLLKTFIFAQAWERLGVVTLKWHYINFIDYIASQNYLVQKGLATLYWLLCNLSVSAGPTISLTKQVTSCVLDPSRTISHWKYRKYRHIFASKTSSQPTLICCSCTLLKCSI